MTGLFIDGLVNLNLITVLLSSLVFFIRNSLKPLDGSSFAHVRIDGDVREGTIGCCAMPVRDLRGDGHRFTFPNDPGGLSFLLVITDALRNHQYLPIRMGMPERSRFGVKGDATRDAICFGIGPYRVVTQTVPLKLVAAPRVASGDLVIVDC